jgi:DNA-binding MarR family transcriptional regulator
MINFVGECDQFMINTGDRPIGYWLKKLDGLIDAEFERQLSEASLSRRQWQLLNLISDGPRSVPELEAELEPFLHNDLDDLSDALFGLVTRGWADSVVNIVSLTETGQAQFELLKAKVANVREALTAGISAEEYQATIDVLARMAANLESQGNTGDQTDQESRSAGHRATPSMM